MNSLSADSANSIITRHELAAMLRLSIPTVDRMCRDGKGPPRVRLATKRVGYRVCDVNRWLDGRVSEAST